jgi:hypothetical protein
MPLLRALHLRGGRTRWPKAMVDRRGSDCVPLHRVSLDYGLTAKEAISRPPLADGLLVDQRPRRDFWGNLSRFLAIGLGSLGTIMAATLA